MRLRGIVDSEVKWSVGEGCGSAGECEFGGCVVVEADVGYGEGVVYSSWIYTRVHVRRCRRRFRYVEGVGGGGCEGGPRLLLERTARAIYSEYDIRVPERSETGTAP